MMEKYNHKKAIVLQYLPDCIVMTGMDVFRRDLEMARKKNFYLE